MPFIRINDAVLHYRFEQSTAGLPPLVLINSLGTDFRIWTDLAEALAEDFSILLFDKRGHGLSELGTAPHRIETFAADLAGLMDRHGLKNAIVCGLSIGGLIAQSLYASRPDLIKTLIFCDTTHKIGTDEMWNGRISAANGPGIQSFADTVMEKWFTPDFHARRSAELSAYRTMLTRQSPAGYSAACAAIRDADFTETAKHIAIPALCVVGDQDGSTSPALVKSFADLIPGAQFEMIANAGHIPCVEQPEALADLIRSFINAQG